MRSELHRPSRLAIVFVVVGLTLSALGVAYIIYAGRPRALPPIVDVHDEANVERLDALARMLGHSLFMFLFLFLAFLIGSYLMVRLGRRVLNRGSLRQRTEYVDAWGSYRLTQEEIDTAMRGLDDDRAGDEPSGDDEDRSLEDNP
jgi:hypothetical protein